MAKWEAEKIYIWFNDKFDTGEENCLPYNPDKFMFHIVGQNEEIDMLSVGSINILKTPKLIEYEPIESFFAHPDVPRYMRSKDGYDWTPSVWENFFIEAMNKKKVLEMTITGLNYVELVTVEDFVYGKAAGKERDTQFTLQIKQYKEAVIEQEEIKIEQEMPPTNTGNDKVAKEIPAKDTIGAKNYLVGPAYPTMDPCRKKDKYGKYKWYFAGVDLYKREGYTFFNYLPVEIRNKNQLSDSYKYISPLGEYLLNYYKDHPQRFWVDAETYFMNAMQDGWNQDNLKSYYNKQGGTPSVEERRAEGKKLYNYLYEKEKKHFNLNWIDLTEAIIYPAKHPELKEYLTAYTGSQYLIVIKSSRSFTLYTLIALSSFKINDGKEVGNVVQEYKKGEIMYARSDESLIKQDNKDGNGKEIQFSVSGRGINGEEKITQA